MGPLSGYKIIEVAGIGPGPFAAMMLSDMGAEVLRLDRVGKKSSVVMPVGTDILNRGRRSVGIDLKQPAAIEAVLRLVEQADALIEGFRPGVTERLGIGPDACLARNPKLVYGRMTGFGQDGPMASAAGHDINYIALGGALGHIGRAGEKPVPPLNLVGDFGGGGMFLAFGVVCALLEASRSGQGQVVDAAMVDGTVTLMAMFSGMMASGLWTQERGANLLDTGSHFYDTYETADGRHVSIGAIEPQFYAELLRLLGLEGEDLPHQMDKSQWPAMKKRFADIFRSKTSDEWCRVMEGSDACFAPVLAFPEVADHPHMKERGAIVNVGGIPQPAPAPRFSRTPGEIQGPPVQVGNDTDVALRDWGFTEDELSALRSNGAIG